MAADGNGEEHQKCGTDSSTRVSVAIVDFRRELQNLRTSDILCDVVLKGAEDGCLGIPCHRNILSLHSSYFRSMFLSGMKESTEKVIQMRNISTSDLSELVDYCYMADLLITESNVQSLLIAASFLDIPAVVKACWKFMEDHMHIKNCLMLYCFASAEAPKNPAMADAAKAFVVKHFVGISGEPEFLELPKNTIIDLIRSDDLYVTREDDVLLAVLRWLHHDLGQRRKEFWEILRYIRSSYLGPQGSDDYLLACINAFIDYSGAERRVHPSEYINALPGCINETFSRHAARKYYGVENIIICAGGHRDGTWTSLLDSVECFNPRTSRWKQLAPLPFSVAKGSLVIIKNDVFLCGGIIGQNDTDVTPRTIRCSLNNALASWSDVAPMQTGRGDVGCASVGDRIYAIGGHGRDSHTLATVERYDVVANRWTYVASLPTPLEKCAVVSFDGRLYTFGGCKSNTSSAIDSAFCYDPKANIWSELPKIPTARYRASVCVGSDQWIYVIGGRGSWGGLSCVEAFNPRTNQWIKKRDMSRKLSSVGTCCIGDKLYALGGFNASGETSVEVYDVFLDTWTTIESRLPNGKWAFGCGVIEIAKDRIQEFYV
ncbi:kelch-like protein 4 [Paramacrobiotus metropolitanus]|uniref:kelch-like protein 4 n=1 Tax=Paramacrobiotus metropolitanus TaxID=2943436 RepID=UPI0024463871|nr:kelch-like protein 4 [Paramacrobiotus metropolitanus]